MDIVPYGPAHLDGVHEIYVRVTRNAAHCRFLPGRDHLGASLATASGRMQLLVATEADKVRGLAAVREPAVAEDGVLEAQVTALFAEEDQVAATLLAAAMARVQGSRRVIAFPESHRACPIPAYNAGWDGLSDQLHPAARALARAGFTPIYRELHLEATAPYFPPVVTPAPPGVTIVAGDEAQGTSRVRGIRDGVEVGGCIWSMLGHVSDHLQAASRGYVDGLWVEEAQRRRGLARHLLTSALRRMAEQGARGCWLTTGAANWPAQPLYLSLGFEIVDASSSWRKDLLAG